MEGRFWYKTKFINLTISRLMSNVIDNETGRPLADGKVTHIIDWCGRKIGLVRINKTHELFILFLFFIFCWFWPTMLRKCLFTFFKSFACLALQKKPLQRKSCNLSHQKQIYQNFQWARFFKKCWCDKNRNHFDLTNL